MISQYLAVGAGGAVGAILRYWLGLRVNGIMGSAFPWSTLAVNLIGSLLVGVCMVLIAGKTAGSELWRLGLMVGLLGGFTTFSAFSLQTLDLMQQQALLKAGGNVVLSVAGCLLGTWLGFLLGQAVKKSA